MAGTIQAPDELADVDHNVSMKSGLDGRNNPEHDIDWPDGEVSQ